jgi:hypothetical protein
MLYVIDWVCIDHIQNPIWQLKTFRNFNLRLYTCLPILIMCIRDELCCSTNKSIGESYFGTTQMNFQ